MDFFHVCVLYSSDAVVSHIVLYCCSVSSGYSTRTAWGRLVIKCFSSDSKLNVCFSSENPADRLINPLINNQQTVGLCAVLKQDVGMCVFAFCTSSLHTSLLICHSALFLFNCLISSNVLKSNIETAGFWAQCEQPAVSVRWSACEVKPHGLRPQTSQTVYLQLTLFWTS